MAKIAIIGGGVIGLACAYYLRKQNNEVVVIDKSRPGKGCSEGNMGWICPTLSEPVPSPGLVGTSIKWLMKKDSPLYIKPTAMPSLSSWLYQFWRNCNEQSFNQGFKAGLEISGNALNLFDELEADGVEFEMHRNGMLVVFKKEDDLEHKFIKLSRVVEFGLPRPEMLSSSKVIEMEPNIISGIAGGLFLPSERHVRPESLIHGLAQWLYANGVQIMSNSEVTKIVRSGDQVTGLLCGTESIDADMFMLATGIGATSMLKDIGFQLPMTAGKGYSVTMSSPSLKFKQPVYFGDTRAGISPFNESLRVGGTMELSGINTDIDMRRVNSIRSSVGGYLNKELRGEKEVVWTGMRPMTPDGLPVLGSIPGLKNMFMATGHAMNGVSMALSTGILMSDLMFLNNPEIDLTPFSPHRFSNESTLTLT
jgi:D-amino-acid dehydrogenase